MDKRSNHTNRQEEAKAVHSSAEVGDYERMVIHGGRAEAGMKPLHSSRNLVLTGKGSKTGTRRVSQNVGCMSSMADDSTFTDNGNRVVVILAIGLYVSLCLSIFPFCVDDAYISFLYGKNLVEIRSIVPAEAQYYQGYTNFLYVIVSALLYIVGGPYYIESLAKGFLILCGTLTIYMMSKALNHFKVHPFPSALAVFSLATSTPFVVWTVGALETIFLACLLMFAVYVYLTNQPMYLFALAAAACFLTRMDSVLILAPLVCAMIVYRKSSSEGVIRDLILGFILPCMLYLIWAYYYYGSFLPASTYKLPYTLIGLVYSIVFGTYYFGVFLMVNQHWAMIFMLYFVLMYFLTPPMRDVRASAVCLGLTAYLGYVIFTGPVHMMFCFRHYTPLLPVLITIIAIYYPRFVSTVQPPALISVVLDRRWVRTMVIIGLIIINLTTLGYAYWISMLFTSEDRMDYANHNNVSIRGYTAMVKRWKFAACKFNALIPSDATVKCWSAGIFPFFIQADVFDELLLGSSRTGVYDYVITYHGHQEKVPTGVVRAPEDPPPAYTTDYGWHTDYWLRKVTDQPDASKESRQVQLESRPAPKYEHRRK